MLSAHGERSEKGLEKPAIIGGRKNPGACDIRVRKPVLYLRHRIKEERSIKMSELENKKELNVEEKVTGGSDRPLPFPQDRRGGLGRRGRVGR